MIAPLIWRTRGSPPLPPPRPGSCAPGRMRRARAAVLRRGIWGRSAAATSCCAAALGAIEAPRRLGVAAGQCISGPAGGARRRRGLLPRRRLRQLRRGAADPRALARSLLLAGQGRGHGGALPRSSWTAFSRSPPCAGRSCSSFPPPCALAVLEEIGGRLPGAARSGLAGGHAAALEALFGTLRLFSVLDTEPLLTGADLSHAILSPDPSGDYPRHGRGDPAGLSLPAGEAGPPGGAGGAGYARRLIRPGKAERKRHVGGFSVSREPGTRPAGCTSRQICC